MNAPSFVAGMGIVSAIGNDLQTNLNSLCEEKAGIEPCNGFPLPGIVHYLSVK